MNMLDDKSNTTHKNFNIEFPKTDAINFNGELMNSNNSSTNFNSNNFKEENLDFYNSKLSQISKKYEKYSKLKDLINNDNVLKVKLYKVKENKEKIVKTGSNKNIERSKYNDCRMSFNQPKIYMSEREEVYLYNNVSFNNINSKYQSSHHENVNISNFNKNENNNDTLNDKKNTFIEDKSKLIIEHKSDIDEEKELRIELNNHIKDVRFL